MVWRVSEISSWASARIVLRMSTMFARNANCSFSKVSVILLVILLSMLAMWLITPSLVGHSSVKSASLPTIPSSCEGIELVSLREMLSNTSDPETRQMLEVKIKVAEQEARNCADTVAYRAPSTKPDPDSIRPPTSTQFPTSMPLLGIQEAIQLPISDFSTTNMWAGYVDGNLIEVYAGALRDEYWQLNPNTPSQGAVYVMVNGKVRGRYLITPMQSGALRIEAVCNNTQLVLHSTTGESFVFDVLTFIFLPDFFDNVSCSDEAP